VLALFFSMQVFGIYVKKNIYIYIYLWESMSIALL
jgi:hypothetical protein